MYKLLPLYCCAAHGKNIMKTFIVWNMANVKYSVPYLKFSAYINVYSRTRNHVNDYKLFLHFDVITNTCKHKDLCCFVNCKSWHKMCY
jgi:hypothetical protein